MEDRSKNTSQRLPPIILDRKRSCWGRFCEIIGMVSHLVAISFTGFMIYLAWPLTNLFSWHPILMSIAFAFLMSESIMFFSSESTLIPKVNRKSKVSYHWITMTTAIACALIGFAIIFINKVLHDKPHFKSWHGTMGLVVIIYMCIQAFGGAFHLFPKFTSKFVKLADLKLYHATSGLCLFILVITTLVLALYSNWMQQKAGETGWYFLLGCLMWLTTVITNQVTTEYLPRALKKPSSQY
ncbi:cytochrome b561 domain-containing protein 2-like [Lytechinus variegatus]|uniref:cytochrome b561 domain-containing protein 2-like n=1 Tax=Lytechinus variegatus TaxID=7654 RepID=UPI001BB2C109|nr:cytochrome b561 domain-containing protein 2-like [Lytechinus variegatus]